MLVHVSCKENRDYEIPCEMGVAQSFGVCEILCWYTLLSTVPYYFTIVSRAVKNLGKILLFASSVLCQILQPAVNLQPAA